MVFCSRSDGHSICVCIFIIILFFCSVVHLAENKAVMRYTSPLPPPLGQVSTSFCPSISLTTFVDRSSG